MERKNTLTHGLLLLSGCAIPVLLHAQQWVPVTGNVGGMTLCQTISAETCQAAGDGGTMFVTHDGGASFDSVQTIFTTEWFNDLHFPTAQVGYACGGSHFGFHTSIIAKTEDGGTTWFPLTYDTLPWYTLNSIRFFNAEVGLVSGNVGSFYRTEDGGNTFIPVNLPLIGYNTVTDIYFDGDVAYICTRATKYEDGDDQDDDYYHILKSTDMGQNWTVMYSDTVLNRTLTTDRGINGICFQGEIGMACGYNGLLLRTQDGGTSWSESTIAQDTTTLWDLEMVNAQLAYIITGFAYAGGYRNTLRTEDGGQTWSVMPEKFMNISIKNGTGYAVDDTYHLFKNTQVVNGIRDITPALISIFPNPSSGVVQVQMPQHMPSGLLTLFDPSGRACMELPFRHADQLSFDAGDLAAGPYVVEVRGQGTDLVYRQRIILQ